MAENNIKWTDQQRRAITHRGKDVLVTASAGTGKTAVLSGRCVDILADKSAGGDVLSMLVLTFTDAAAEEMRTRIAEALRVAFLESGDRNLGRQLMLVGGSDISTIHSFCRRLIAENFYKLGVDPTFRVIESDEQNLLKAEVLERCIDWAWQQNDIATGLEQLLGRRDLRTNDGFLGKIIKISNFLDGVVWRRQWYDRALRLAETVDPFTSELGKKQKQILAEKLRTIFAQLQAAQKLYEDKVAGADLGPVCGDAFPEQIVRCIELLKAGDSDKCAELIRGFDKPTVRKPKDLPEPVAAVIRETVKGAVDSFEQLSGLAVVNPDYLDRLSGAVRLQTQIVIKLVKRFDQLYSQAKRAINCMDFADLEYYALRLLTQDSSDEKLVPSETALALRRKYKYVFVDEYQDINPVQQAILEAVGSRGNVFVVGDVKQSIYAFRGAEPKIFLESLKAASPDPKSTQHQLRVDLNANFRSVKGILDFVNKMFGRIMTASVGQIDYDESAILRPAGQHKTEGKKPAAVELHILDEQKSDKESADIYSSRQRQAILIAQRIRQMVGADSAKPEFEIYDKQQGKFRAVEYRDIVILMRSPAKRAQSYVEMLRLVGVPVNCQSSAGYFEATEISDMLCLLKVLDNPQRDIELATVLRSPLFKVSDTELAKIKIHSKTNEACCGFYDCVVEYCATGDDTKLANKLKEILAVIERWRKVARRCHLADLIWQVYRQTNFLSFVSALPSGQGRRANLLRLHERAIEFEGFASSAGVASLNRFVEFVERLQESGRDWATAEPDAEAKNAVRITSIHKSKGLEFPVVFLAELNSKFNTQSYKDDCLVDADGSLGLQIIDRRANAKLSSLAHQVVAEEKYSAGLAEEMRILYVAMTRARDRLVLTGSQKKKHCQNIVCRGFFFGDEKVTDWQLQSCSSFLDWILLGLSDQGNLHKALETGLAEKGASDDLFSVELHDPNQLELAAQIAKSKPSEAKQDIHLTKKMNAKQQAAKLLAKVKESLDWRYQFAPAVSSPAKTSVTELTHRDDEYAKLDYSKALDRKPKVALTAERDFVETCDARLIGIATHLLIASLDLSKAVNTESVERTKEKLLADGAITKAVAKNINTSWIIGFFESELGKIALDRRNVVEREWPFTSAVPASQWQLGDSSHESRVTDDESIIVQGIIDMLVRSPQGLVVIDFKTDNVTAKEVQARAELYRQQLDLYSDAAGKILKTKIISKWLYFLSPGCAIEID